MKNIKLIPIMIFQVGISIYIISIQFTLASVISPHNTVLISDNLSSSLETCQTPGCIRTASEVLEYMDEKSNPCDDFYQFACGGYVAKHSIPEDETSVGVFSDVEDELSLQLKELLERQLDGTEAKFVKILKGVYDSCMDLDMIENSKSEPLEAVLNTLGGWPVVQGENWVDSNFNWMETVFKIRNLGYSHNTLVSTDVDTDLKNNTANTIMIDQPLFGMSDRTYLLNGLNDSSTEAYFNLMVKTANKLGATELTSRNELMNALTFETNLAKFSLPREERRNFTALYNKFTVSQLKELTPQVDWLKFLNGVINHPISELDSIIIIEPVFMKKFAELIVKTDKRTIANYLLWRVVKESLSMLSNDWRHLAQEYTTKISGSTKEKPRWKQCLASLSYNLGLALSSYYVKNYFQAESKVKADEIVKYIRKEFYFMLENLEWMDESTKSEAKEKANAIIPYIGYPQELVNDSLVLEVYQNLTIITENYFNNILNLEKWNIDYSFSKLRKPNVKGDWKKHALVAVVNAYYFTSENSIDFPAGILQKAFFSKDRPNYMNFGGIGYVIGHEITHGFDDIGRQFDKDGNNKNWWDEATDNHFREKAKCIIYQYGNYTVENDLKLNGVNTQGENIADNGGMKQAYLAYQSWVKDNGAEQKLPGLKYTPGQLFWISAANVWCSKLRPQALKDSIISGVHSPDQIRVNGPMSNFAEFSEEFQCPLGSPMNPRNKCKVW